MAALKRGGFVFKGQRGSHVKLKHLLRGNVVIVPMHSEIKRGTMKSILKQAGVTEEEFVALL